MSTPVTMSFDSDTHKVVPRHLTPEMIADAVMSTLIPEPDTDAALAREAAALVLSRMDKGVGIALEALITGIAPMIAAYRSMLAVAPLPLNPGFTWEYGEELQEAHGDDTFYDIVFDGPPGSQSGRFIEVENPEGKSICVGRWIDRGDGLWAFRIPSPAVQKREKQ
ncbi:hypothetical protein [Pandoraea apista]|uniref:hypothetical protein n=1 Tax=Pandoraea apista TaxID=93218 RepID=UPI000F683D69|nr:hypothetical protein [Pandoraea apista]